jgi:acyl-CoA thioester hydrolase
VLQAWLIVLLQKGGLFPVADKEHVLKTMAITTIPYQDADPSGVVWHGNYFRYFDLARCALLDKIDYGYRQMEASRYVWPIVDTRVKFIRPVYYGDVIRVSAELIEWEYRLRISYEIFAKNESCTTRGQTIQVAVDISTGELNMAAPDALVDRLRGIGVIS